MDLSKNFLRLCSLILFIHCGVRSEINSHAQRYNNVEAVLTGAEREVAIEILLKDPKATFFTGENMTGEVVNYDSTSTTWPGGCQNIILENEPARVIKSWRTSESCVRVFGVSHCGGQSISLYPKPNSGSFNNFLAPLQGLPWVVSIGPCPRNEFKYAKVFLNGPKVSLTKDESNFHQVPDIADFVGWETYAQGKATKLNSTTNAVQFYYMEQGRPKWLGAYFKSRHLNNSTGRTAERNHAIPPGLGGPRDEAYNTFQQSQGNFVEWQKVTDQIEPYLRADLDSGVRIYLTFVYEGSSVTRPYGFYYRINYFKTNNRAKLPEDESFAKHWY